LLASTMELLSTQRDSLTYPDDGTGRGVNHVTAVQRCLLQ
jgi:hypothetical protein